jgi:hypothetical protein
MTIQGVHGRASDGEASVVRAPVALGEHNESAPIDEKNAKPNRLRLGDLYFRGPKC